MSTSLIFYTASMWVLGEGLGAYGTGSYEVFPYSVNILFAGILTGIVCACFVWLFAKALNFIFSIFWKGV